MTHCVPIVLSLRPVKEGRMLFDLLTRRAGTAWGDYARAFRFATLGDDIDAQDQTVIVLGNPLRRYLELEPRMILPTVLDGVTYRQLPSPVDHSDWYEDPLCAEVAAMMLEDMMQGETNARH